MWLQAITLFWHICHISFKLKWDFNHVAVDKYEGTTCFFVFFYHRWDVYLFTSNMNIHVQTGKRNLICKSSAVYTLTKSRRRLMLHTCRATSHQGERSKWARGEVHQASYTRTFAEKLFQDQWQTHIKKGAGCKETKSEKKVSHHLRCVVGGRWHHPLSLNVIIAERLTMDHF